MRWMQMQWSEGGVQVVYSLGWFSEVVKFLFRYDVQLARIRIYACVTMHSVATGEYTHACNACLQQRVWGWHCAVVGKKPSITPDPGGHRPQVWQCCVATEGRWSWGRLPGPECALRRSSTTPARDWLTLPEIWLPFAGSHELGMAGSSTGYQVHGQLAEVSLHAVRTLRYMAVAGLV